MISDPPSLKVRLGREWLTEFLTGDTLFVSWIDEFIDAFLSFSPVMNLAPVGSEEGQEVAGRSVLPDSD